MPGKYPISKKELEDLYNLLQEKIDLANKKLANPSMKLDPASNLAYLILKHNGTETEARTAVFEFMLDCFKAWLIMNHTKIITRGFSS